MPLAQAAPWIIIVLATHVTPTAAETLLFSVSGPDSSYLGGQVRGLGDTNGDGYSDVVITSGPGEQILVHLYHGGATPDTVADLTIEVPSNPRIARAGDANNDGYNDLLIGLPDEGAGEARLYYLGPTPDSTADLTFTRSGSPGDEFGHALVGVDINNDGYSDVIVAMPYSDVFDEVDAGRVTVYYMGPSPDTSPDITYVNSGSTGYGSSVVALGDRFSPDGYGDFLLAPDFPWKAQEFHGGPTGPTWVNTETYLWQPRFAPAGDVDGDGDDELAVFKPSLTASEVHVGEDLGVVFPEHVLIQGSSTSSSWGVMAPNPVGDLDLDGYADFVIGDPGIFSENGRVFVYFLGPGAGFEPTAAETLSAPPDDWLGNTLDGAGDFNGDGAPDLIVGASRANQARGLAEIYSFWTPPVSSPEPGVATPKELTLGVPRPNPASDGATIRLSVGLHHGSEVALSLFDVGGRRVARRAPQWLPPGPSTISWSPDPGAGVYFLRAETGDGSSAVQRMVVVK